jgi:hypothetical protein
MLLAQDVHQDPQSSHNHITRSAIHQVLLNEIETPFAMLHMFNPAFINSPQLVSIFTNGEWSKSASSLSRNLSYYSRYWCRALQPRVLLLLGLIVVKLLRKLSPQAELSKLSIMPSPSKPPALLFCRLWLNVGVVGDDLVAPW